MGKAGDWGLMIVPPVLKLYRAGDGRWTIEFCKVVILELLLSTSVWAVNGDMGVGTDPLANGSLAHPWLIEDLADFDAFAGNSVYWATGVHTKLMTDIDLSSKTYTAAVIAPDTSTISDWQGIPFTGVFDGNDHAISNLTIMESTKDWIGLFGYVDFRGQITNLGLVNINIRGYAYVGGLAGYTNNCTISSCYVTGTVSGTTAVGGLAGYNNSSTVLFCYATCAVSGSANSVGGLVGSNRDMSATIMCCYATGMVSGSYYVGGLVGVQFQGAIMNCYSTGMASGATYVGGLIGNNYGAVIQSYSTGKPTGTSKVGGLCGYAQAGSNYLDIGNVWDTETSQTTISMMGTGKTKVQMQTPSTFTAAGWDFSENDGDGKNWMMLREGEDYPRLAWQEVYAGDVAGLYGVDMVDFAELARNWMEACAGDCEEADIDGSGVVEFGDVVMLADDWLTQ